MASRRKYRQKWLRWHKQYGRKAYKELQRTFHRYTNNIEWDMLTKFNYIAEIQFAITNKAMSDTYKTIYENIGMIHGKRVGRGINRELKAFTDDEFESQFLRELGIFFADPRNGWTNRITTVNKTFAEDIIKLLSVRLDKGQTIEQAQREVRKIVNRPNFGRTQALRIARTETTAAANFAASQASSVSGFVMVKEWISTLDSRTRRIPEDAYDHVRVNGQRRPEQEPFNVSGQALMYPGDPKGSSGNVINCRCAMAVIPARNEQGELIPV